MSVTAHENKDKGMYPHPGGAVSKSYTYLTPQKEHWAFEMLFSCFFFQLAILIFPARQETNWPFLIRSEGVFLPRSPPTTPLEVILTFEGQMWNQSDI